MNPKTKETLERLAKEFELTVNVSTLTTHEALELVIELIRLEVNRLNKIFDIIDNPSPAEIQTDKKTDNFGDFSIIPPKHATENL